MKKRNLKNKVFCIYFNKEKLNPKKIFKIFRAKGRIKSLKLFDENYYLNEDLDVRNSNMNPLDHYIYHGWIGKRNPSSKFDGNYYLSRYQDVRESEVNSLVHYVLHGKDEGRFPNYKAEFTLSPQNKSKLNGIYKRHKKRN